MSLLQIALTIIVVGVLLWLANSYVPMEARVKQILNIVVIILLILYLLKAFGVWSYLAGMRV